MYSSVRSINKDKWFKIITKERKFDLSDFDGVIIDLIDKTHPNGSTSDISLDSVDGSKPFITSYKSFELSVELYVRGIDKRDVDLLIFKLNNMLSIKEPYYVRHSDLPSVKYAVLPNPKIESDRKTRQDYTVTITFEVYKGYSESYVSTQHLKSLQEVYQFGDRVVWDEDDVRYNHFSQNFAIYNASNDYIDPMNNHYFNLRINTYAPKGITIYNATTGDRLTYNQPLKRTDVFVLEGVYPFVNGDRVGRYTNFEYLTLAPGYNEIYIYGDGMEKPESHWDFYFVYR